MVAILAGVGLLLLAACAAETEPVATQDVVSGVPWTAPETAKYRLLDDGDLKGSAVLRVERKDERLRLSQEFEDVDATFQDVVAVVADAASLKPETVERTIEGPDGERLWQVEYGPRQVVVRQQADDDRRTDRLELPPHAYDSWSDLFLWRTIDFRRGYTASYNDVGTAILAKPQTGTTTLEVITTERITVPAGSFRVWRLEVRLEGRVQRVWIADRPDRALVRYDSGNLLWELESLE
ncbi:MAG: DUF3108 domain-containing protein [Chloroflexi bacterium]|nr:DUF3108 domain-containing protein [Chloroflexota bacterium]